MTDLLDHVLESSRGRETISIGDVLEVVAGRGFGSLLIIPGVITISPLGAIPGVPLVISIVLVLIAGQRLMGMQTPWVPRALRSRSVSEPAVERAVDRLRPWTRRIDRVLRPRLVVLIRGPMERVLALIVVLLGVAMVPLGFVPFAIMLPGAGVLMFGLALLGRDGLLGLVGYVATVCTAGLIIWTVV